MAKGKWQRLSIGFENQALALRITADELASLRSALEERGEGWHELAAEDGTIALDLGKVVFLRIEQEEQRVGFGA